MNIKGKKILITGGLGFIGSNLSKRLEDCGAVVDIFDRNQGDDILDVKNLKTVIKKKYDAIYHLAAFSGNQQSNKNRLKCFQTNAIATINLFDLVVKYCPETKIILSNSRLEYGKPKYLPVDENHSTIPLSAYGLSKLVTTQMAIVYSKTKKLNFTVFRTSNVYGPHEKQKFEGYNLINYFINQARKNKELVIFGDGNQLRDYIYIDDLTNAFSLALNQKADNKIYNLGYGTGISLKQMAQLILKLVGKGKIMFKKWPADYRQVETGSYVTDISKIKKELGFVPKIDFAQGIAYSI